MVPTDARLIEVVNLEADEAALTGESVPVRKDPGAVFGDKEEDEDVGPGDRLNVVFSSTTITKGRGKAVVFATGMSTEMGAIAAALRADGAEKRQLERDENGNAGIGAYLLFAVGKTWDYLGEFLGVTVGTPLQKKMSKLFLSILGIAVVCAIIVIGANGFTSRNDVIIYAITVAIGTLPVTLILVLTVTMAAGTKVMVQRHVLVRNMRSLEALGGVTSKSFSKHIRSYENSSNVPRYLLRQDWHSYAGKDGYTHGLASGPWNLQHQCYKRAAQSRGRGRRIRSSRAQEHHSRYDKHSRCCS